MRIRRRETVMKFIEIVQTSPGPHFIVRLMGQPRVLARPQSPREAFEAAETIGAKLKKLGLEYRIVY